MGMFMKLCFGLLFLSMISLVCASVLPGSSNFVNVSLSNESGLITGLANCTGSVVNMGNRSLFVNGTNLSTSNLGWFWFNYTAPNSEGLTLAVSVECIFGSESATYWEDVLVSSSPSMGGGISPGGASTAIFSIQNFTLVDDFDKTIVDLRKLNTLNFRVFYSYGTTGISAISNVVRVLNDGEEIVKSGSINSSAVGIYDVKIDLEGLTPGDYTLVEMFDYKTIKHDFKIIDMDTGLWDNITRGKNGIIGIVIISVFFLILLSLVLVLIQRRKKKNSGGQTPSKVA